MSAAVDATTPTTEAAIFARPWDAGDGSFTPDLARHIFGMKFGPADVDRMHELAARNRDGRITAAELGEFDHYLRVADLLGILQSKARMRLAGC